jgi:hypothetical protein
VAGQRNVGLETEAARQAADLIDHRRIHLGRVAAALQQGQHQGGEFVAHGDAGKADARRLAGAADGERGLAGVVAILAHGDLGRERGDVGQQLAHLARGGAVVERGDEFDRGLELFEVGRELGLDVGVEHGFLR